MRKSLRSIHFLAATASFLAAALHQPATGVAQYFEKLPSTVNSPSTSQLVPIISPDGRTLYFTRPRISIDSSEVFDIWMSRREEAGFMDAEYIGDNLSSRFGVAVTSVAPDNNTLYLMGKLKEDSPPEERIYVSHRTGSGWSIPEPIRVKNLRARGYYTDYSFGTDQRTLLMSVERDSSLGERDLYVSFLDEKSRSWSQPQWLGPKLNTKYPEITPFLSSDGRTLYFSSGRPGGSGEVDVYRSERIGDSWTEWTEPENLGPGVNRPGRNVFFSEDAKGEYGYLSWRRTPQERFAIYKVKVPRKKVQAVALLNGRVLGDNGEPLLASIRYERLSDGATLGTARSNPNTGEFQLSLPGGEFYSIHAELEGYAPTSEALDLRDLTGYKTISRDLTLTELRKGVTVRLNNIFFETDRSTLLATSYPELDRLRSLLLENARIRISIDGHTDATGSAQHNRTLSKERAEAVRAYLAEKGIAASRLEAAAFGPDKPIADNNTEEGRALNRRVEFRILEN